jgi:hypothetical protein
LVLIFGFLGTVDHPDAGISLVAELRVVMQVVLEDQMPVFVKGLKESARETNIWKWLHLLVTEVVLVNYTLKRQTHGR